MRTHRHYGREVWEAACEWARTDTGPAFTTEGMWTARKLQFLCYYLEQVARGMRNSRYFPDGLVFVDLFAGCGVSIAKDENGVKHRLPGSGVLAASVGQNAFGRLLLIEREPASLDLVLSRIRSRGYSGEAMKWCGDINALIPEVVKQIPRRSLNVAFVDPCSLDVHFETIRTLAMGRPVDLIILFSDRIDLQRNIHDLYYPRVNDKLDLFLGEDSNWRAEYDSLQERSGTRLRELFAQIYCRQLAKLGYTHSKAWPLEGPQGPMFRLVFASKNPLGLKYCDIAGAEDLGGQRGLFPGISP
jgi:three-Cys-motif partner protein